MQKTASCLENRVAIGLRAEVRKGYRTESGLTIGGSRAAQDCLLVFVRERRYAALLPWECRSVSRYSTYWLRLTPWDFAAFAMSACRRLGTRMRNLPL